MNEINRNLGQIIKTLRTKSAANPALIFSAICLVGGMPGALLAQHPINLVFAGIAVLGVVLCACQLLFFTFFDRDRLQDEEHIENRIVLEAISARLGDKSHEIEISATPVLTGNPSLEGDA